MFDILDMFDNRYIRYSVVATVVVLVLYLLYVLVQSKEKYIGKGYAIPGYENFSGPSCRGATVRRLGQEFSQPNQGVHGITYVDEIREHVPVSQSKLSQEALVNGRGEPDFWEIGNTLAAYRRRQSPILETDASIEHLEEGSPAAQVEEELLKLYLYN